MVSIALPGLLYWNKTSIKACNFLLMQLHVAENAIENAASTMRTRLSGADSVQPRESAPHVAQINVGNPGILLGRRKRQLRACGAHAGLLAQRGDARGAASGRGSRGRIDRGRRYVDGLKPKTHEFKN